VVTTGSASIVQTSTSSNSNSESSPMIGAEELVVLNSEVAVLRKKVEDLKGDLMEEKLENEDLSIDNHNFKLENELLKGDLTEAVKVNGEGQVYCQKLTGDLKKVRGSLKTARGSAEDLLKKVNAQEKINVKQLHPELSNFQHSYNTGCKLEKCAEHMNLAFRTVRNLGFQTERQFAVIKSLNDELEKNGLKTRAVYDKCSSGFYGFMEYENGKRVTCRLFSQVESGSQEIGAPETILATMTACGNSIHSTRDPTKPTTQMIIKSLKSGAPYKTRNSWNSVVRIMDGEEVKVLKSFERNQKNLGNTFPVTHSKDKLMKVSKSGSKSSSKFSLNKVPPPTTYSSSYKSGTSKKSIPSKTKNSTSTAAQVASRRAAPRDPESDNDMVE